MRIAAVPLLTFIAISFLLAMPPAHTPPYSVPRPHPAGIIIHHSASGAYVDGEAVDVRLIDRWHAKRGFEVRAAGRQLHVGYHYVILPDGTIQSGRPEFVRGAHARQFNDRLGICLVGNFSSRANHRGRAQPMAPTAAQQQALAGLISLLRIKHNLPAQSVIRHCDMGAITDCPGDRLPFASLMRVVDQRMASARPTHPSDAPLPPAPARGGSYPAAATLALLCWLVAALAVPAKLGIHQNRWAMRWDVRVISSAARRTG